MTKREYFSVIDGIVVASGNAQTAEIREFIAHEIELLNRKSSKGSKPTARQIENADFKNVILEILGASDKPMTIPEIMAADSRLADMTNQRVSALLIQLGTAKGSGEVVKTYEKKVAYFALA